MINPLLHALSPVVNDPHRRSPELHLKQQHRRLNLCFGVSTTGQMKTVNNSNTNSADFSPCASRDRHVCLFQLFSRCFLNALHWLGVSTPLALPWIAWHSLILGHTRAVVVWTRSWLSPISVVISTKSCSKECCVLLPETTRFPPSKVCWQMWMEEAVIFYTRRA